MLMCHVLAITENDLSKEERDQKKQRIKRVKANAIIQFLTSSSKNFERNFERYKKRHPGAIEWTH